MNGAYVHSESLMGTVVTIEVIGHDRNFHERCEREATVRRAVTWFQRVEKALTRFDECSELRQLSARSGVPVTVSPILYEAVRISLTAAEATRGAFAPSAFPWWESVGFSRDFRSGQPVGSN